MRIGGHRRDEDIGIDLVPLIDVVLCLLIFFVVTASFDGRSVLKLQLPRADSQPVSVPNQPLVLLVNADGRYFVQDREVLRPDIDSLKQSLVDVAGQRRDSSVVLRADARTPHQAVVTALDALGQLGFRNVAIATTPAEAKKAP